MAASNDSGKKVTIDTLNTLDVNGDQVQVNSAGDIKKVKRKTLFKNAADRVKKAADENSNHLTPEQQQQLMAMMKAKQAA